MAKSVGVVTNLSRSVSRFGVLGDLGVFGDRIEGFESAISFSMPVLFLPLVSLSSSCLSNDVLSCKARERGVGG